MEYSMSNQNSVVYVTSEDSRGGILNASYKFLIRSLAISAAVKICLQTVLKIRQG